MLACLVGAASLSCGQTSATSTDAGCPPGIALYVGRPVISAGTGVASVVSSDNGSTVMAVLGSTTTRQAATLEFSNVGCADLTILKVTQADQASNFSIDLQPGETLLAQGPAVPVAVHFVPFLTGISTTTFVITTDSSVVPTVTLKLTGLAVKLSLSLVPQTIDFGNVVVNTTATQSLAMTNNSGIDVTVTLGQMKGTDPLVFVSFPASPARITLHDKETQAITVQYTPLVASPRQNQAYFSIALCSSGTGCNPLVSLRGTPVTNGWTIDPSGGDFGFVPPGRAVPRFLTLSSSTGTPLTLTADPLVLNHNPDGTKTTNGPFQLGAGYPKKGTVGLSIAIPILIVSDPRAAAGDYSGELDLSVDQPSGVFNAEVPLGGYLNAGAAISCSPPLLDFGATPLGTSRVLSVLCTNVGHDVPGHPEGNLFIPDPTGLGPGLSIEGGTPAFQASFNQPFPASGLAAGESTQIDVTYLPTVSGPSADTLAISSNDSQSPTIRISLSGSGF